MAHIATDLAVTLPEDRPGMLSKAVSAVSVAGINLEGHAEMEGVVHVLRRNYRLDTVDAAALARAGSVLRDIGQTVTHNLYRGAREESRFEARATNVQIPKSALPAYRKFVYAEGQAFLEKVDAWLTAAEITEQEGASRAAQRIGLGLYWIQSGEATE